MGGVEWSGILADYSLEWLVPGTQSSWFLTYYTILHGLVFGVLAAIGLFVFRIAEDVHIGPVIAAAALAAFVSSNIGVNMIGSSADARAEAPLWILSGVTEGGISAGLLMAALAAMMPFFRRALRIAVVVTAGAAAGGIAIAVGYVLLYAGLDPAEESALMLSLPILTYIAIMQGGIGAALGVVSTPQGHSEKINGADDILSR